MTGNVLKPVFEKRIPQGDDKPRSTCVSCGHIDYKNPKIVAGVVAALPDDNRILMCRRAIPPRVGAWTIPAGFLEQGEDIKEGAAREAFEEAGAKVRVGDLLAMYQILEHSVVLMIFRGELETANIAAGMESSEVGLFDPDKLPDDIAFPMVSMAIARYMETKGQGNFSPSIVRLDANVPASLKDLNL